MVISKPLGWIGVMEKHYEALMYQSVISNKIIKQ